MFILRLSTTKWLPRVAGGKRSTTTGTSDATNGFDPNGVAEFVGHAATPLGSSVQARIRIPVVALRLPPATGLNPCGIKVAQFLFGHNPKF